MGARIDQHGAAVHDGVAIVPNAIFLRNFIVGYACFGQHGADPDVLVIMIGGHMPLLDIMMKTRPLIDAENAVDAANYATNDTADDGADRSGSSFALS